MLVETLNVAFVKKKKTRFIVVLSNLPPVQIYDAKKT